MSALNILILEDDPSLGQLIVEHLEMNGYSVTLAVNGEEGTQILQRSPFDLCLVDVMMPKKDGFTFVRELRDHDRQTPVIFLTARSLKEDRIEGFRIGADDYITKPFSIEELLLRIQAVLRRTQTSDPSSIQQTEFHIGDYYFDATRQCLERDGTRRRLTARETELLQLLCSRMNQLLTREEALNRIWGGDNYFYGRSMDVFISRLRKYFKDDNRVEIMGVHGKGFRLIVHGNP